MSDCSDSETFNTVTGTCEGRECGFPNNHPLYDVTGNMFNFNSKVTVCEINETLLMKCNSRGEWEQIEFKTHQAWNHKLTCSEMKIRNPCLTSGVYRNKYGVSLYCDFDTDGGGWTVFQRRYDGSVDFYRTMLEYENGFGDLEMGGEFWLGLKHLAQILHKSKYDFELRVELKDWNNTEGYGLYQTFNISDRSDVYRLSVGSFSGTIGNSLNVQYPANVIHNGQRFSTKDSDNDNNVNQNCAVSYRGAWWYNACFAAHLNGEYLPDPATYERGLIWVTWRLYRDSLKETSMKIRETKMVRN